MAKSNQTKPAAKRKGGGPEPESPSGKALVSSSDPRFTQAVQNYESGLKAMQAHKFDKALTYLEKVVAGPSPELADRAAVHLSTCRQQLSRGDLTSKFKSPEEHYDYAISLVNRRLHHRPRTLRQATEVSPNQGLRLVWRRRP